jgi:hypothetical protein
MAKPTQTPTYDDHRHLFIVISALLAACFATARRSKPAAPAAAAVTPDTWAVVDGGIFRATSSRRPTYGRRIRRSRSPMRRR